MSLLTDVAARLTDKGVDVTTQSLALGACVGDQELAAALDGAAPAEQSQAAPDVATGTARLTAVTIAGFRGIGPEATLHLPADPGLTLVVGNNGSGKSSFAEGVEFALTGDNRRWAKRSKVWRDGWRNLHHPDPALVQAELAVSDHQVRVRRHWAADAGLDESLLEVSDGRDLEGRGWASALELYRPFLPYSELGAMVDDGPTALHDTLSAVLGLDVLATGTRRLRAERLARQRGWKEAVTAAVTLADGLDDVDDPRAREVADLLRAKVPDPDAVAGHATGEAELDPALDVLRVLVGLPGPDLDAVRRATSAVDDALDAARDAADTDAVRDLMVADLLAAARQFHLQHGDADCPVCGAGHLDASWAAQAEQTETTLRGAAGAVASAQQVLDAARRVLAAVATGPPASLHRAGMADVDAALVIETWQALEETNQIEDDRERAVQVRRRAEALSNALADLRGRAKAALALRSDSWAPSSARIARWVDLARPARTAAGVATELKAAEDALNEVMGDLRAERWTPIAAQARQVWADLGQGSSVRVEQVELAGTGTRRRVEVGVTVDGIEGAALGVMSQGELHALALALFLPRASLPESPFGFVVIDDPVQSMDSIRVDGLARVLSKAAEQLQVVVFTHDDRLRQAVFAAGIPATIIEVQRGPDSRVDARASLA